MREHSVPFEQIEKCIFWRFLTKEVASGRFCFFKTSTSKGQQLLVSWNRDSGWLSFVMVGEHLKRLVPVFTTMTYVSTVFRKQYFSWIVIIQQQSDAQHIKRMKRKHIQHPPPLSAAAEATHRLVLSSTCQHYPFERNHFLSQYILSLGENSEM